MNEQEFRLAADRALNDLQRHLAPLVERGDCDVEPGGGVLQILFDDPGGTKFVVSPHAPARQIWVSAMSRGHRLSWNPHREVFALDTGESLVELVSRLVAGRLTAS